MSLYKDEEEDQEAPEQNSKLMAVIAAEPEDPKRDLEDDEPPSKDYSMWKYLSCARLDIGFRLFSMVMHLVDLGTDVYRVAKHYSDGHFWYSGLTFIFMIVPAIVTSVVSAKYYRRDRDSQTIAEEDVSRGWRFARTCGVFLFLSPVIKYAESLYYGFLGHKAKSKQDEERAKQYFDRREQEDTDASLLRLVESYLESAPQLVLQLYIYNMDPEQHEVILRRYVEQVITIWAPVISMAWSLTSYYRIFWKTQKNQHLYVRCPPSWPLFSCHLAFIVTRVALLGLIASLYTRWICPACLVHWLFMLFWIIFEKRNTWPMKLEEILFDMLISVVHLITFFDLEIEKTRNFCIHVAIHFGEHVVFTVYSDTHWISVLFILVIYLLLFIIGFWTLTHTVIHHIHRVNPPEVVILTKYPVCPRTDNLAEQGAQFSIPPVSSDVVRDTAERSEESAI